MENFEEYIVRTYSKYKSIIKKLQKFYSELKTTDEKIAFFTCLKNERNLAFADKVDWVDEINVIVMASKIPDNAREVLEQLIENPKYDGDVVSKAGKAWLYQHGLVVQIVRNNEFGDNAANWLGWKVHQRLEQMNGGANA